MGFAFRDSIRPEPTKKNQNVVALTFRSSKGQLRSRKRKKGSISRRTATRSEKESTAIQTSATHTSNVPDSPIACFTALLDSFSTQRSTLATGQTTSNAAFEFLDLFSASTYPLLLRVVPTANKRPHCVLQK